jgi:hypothetical protein
VFQFGEGPRAQLRIALYPAPIDILTCGSDGKPDSLTRVLYFPTGITVQELRDSLATMCYSAPHRVRGSLSAATVSVLMPTAAWYWWGQCPFRLDFYICHLQIRLWVMRNGDWFRMGAMDSTLEDVRFAGTSHRRIDPPVVRSTGTPDSGREQGDD